jgi:predicted acylesterase/phospholipase RssA
LMQHRREFLKTLATGSALPSLVGAVPDVASTALVRRALVLSGGGALGSYAAGVIGCLAAAAGVNDGEMLSPYEMVCGTSIGALNGWFVATGQYSKLRELWYDISAQHLLRLKRQFAALEDPQAGVGNRVASTMNMASLAKDQAAFFDSDPVLEWISRNVDPERPVVMPFVWVATNLTKQRPEYFYIRRPQASSTLDEDMVRSLQVTLGPRTIIREATPELFHKQLFASAAVPLLWDPVVMPGPDGSLDQYCDGGVAANSPVSVAHAVAAAADVVLLNPPFEEIPDYKNAIEVAAGLWGTMQQKILASDMRNVYFQSVAKRAFGQLPNADVATATQGEPDLAKYVAALPLTKLAFIRPTQGLPVSGAGFDDEEGIGKAYRIGWNDATGGFTPYDWKTFEP